MTSTRAKGGAYQRKIKKWIEDNYPGSYVHNQVSSSSVFINKEGKAQYRSPKGNDILGCIDIVAIIPHKLPVFIQCTMHTGVEKRLKDMIKVPWNIMYASVQLWQDKGGGRTVIKELDQWFAGDNKLVVSELVNKAEIIRGKQIGEIFDDCRE